MMVERPELYPFSSYHYNALGVFDKLIVPHHLYQALGSTDTKRQLAYSRLFRQSIEPEELELIRNATNNAWVLGNEYFKKEIEGLLNRRSERHPTGGDRRSEKFMNRH